MKLTNLRKETSERSDASNWAKQSLISDTPYFYESIEGCNQNTNNVVTHLLERARVDEVEGKSTKQEIINDIIEIEGTETLQRKINFATLFGINLSYILYCDESESVYHFEFISITEVNFNKKHNSYKEFADWIAEIKGWKSTKAFREYNDLPHFDKELRKHKTPWPTNIDCFFTDAENNPIGIIEYQNAKDTGVLTHCNNDHFQCRIAYEENGYYGSYTVYSDDIRRWTSQEILRVQSGLRLIIVTWSQSNKDFIIKELQSVAIPFFPEKDGKPIWKEMSRYKSALNRYVLSNRTKENEDIISKNAKTYNLTNDDGAMGSVVNEPILSYGAKTFPSLYYKSKNKSSENNDFIKSFINILES